MTTFTVEQKSQLAKLMATENLTVEHKKLQTAMFDTKNRVLYLPIWQNMSGFLYDLLTGHEVGHALYTPPEGWHDVAADKSKGRGYKSFLNVLEDARIEKKVIRKYPGLRIAFRKAFDELFDRDFFGVKGKNLDQLSFIDRLNLYTKSQYSLDIHFTDKEQSMVDEVKSLESWDDVVTLTDKIYQYSKEEQFEIETVQDFSDSNGSYDGEELDFDDVEPEEDDTDIESDSETENNKKDKESDSNQNGDQKDEDSDGEELSGSSTVNDKQSKNSEAFDDFDPTCATDNEYRKNEDKLIDEKCKSYLYLQPPTPNLDVIITPVKRVQQLLTESFDQQITTGRFTVADTNKFVQDFKNKNEKYVNLLVKEFEMRKAAKSFSKAKQSDTGDIDVSKLSLYKFDDNIFRKLTVVPKGKSHGLILLLDYSGSMSQNMAGSIEQILVLSLFCRKVNIPFHVYAFSNCSTAWYIDNEGLTPETRQPKAFSEKSKELGTSDLLLREYLNSNMSNAEFNKALKNMILLKMSYLPRPSRHVFRPRSESLSNTPLNESIIALKPIMEKFKKSNNLDITNLVIVHDGEADDLGYYHKDLDPTDIYGRNYHWYNTISENVFLQDKKSKFQSRVCENLNEVLLKWFSETTGSKIFGFYIVPPPNLSRAISSKYRDEKGNRLMFTDIKAYDQKKELMKKFRKDKFLVSKNPGFSSFFFIHGGDDLLTEEESIEIDGKITSSKLKSAFMRYNKNKQINRVLVSKFIEGIAS